MDIGTSESRIKRKIPNEEFLRVWTLSSSPREAGERLGIEPVSARTRAANLRKILGEDVVIRHPRVVKGRKALKDDKEEIERLRELGKKFIKEKKDAE
tara:strand:+ start:142 stop:435 length:294 start_codon:yes stop_codon:yes gene_type:complete